MWKRRLAQAWSVVRSILSDSTPSVKTRKDLAQPALELSDRISICFGIIVAIILFFEDRTNPIVAGVLLFALLCPGAYVLWHLVRVLPWARKGRSGSLAFIISIAVLECIWASAVFAYGRRVWPKRQLVVQLVFKDSPLWTSKRKKRFSEALDDYYVYLRNMGFSFPPELPPLGFIDTNMCLAGGSPGGGIYYTSILISDSDRDQPETAVRMYSSYVFNSYILWDDTGANAIPHDYRANAAAIFACYYDSSFSKKNVCPEGWPNQRWLDAVWDIRQKCGQDYTDKLMFYTFATWKTSPAQTASFDSFFSMKLLAGETVEVSPGEAQPCGFRKVLPLHGIQLGF